MEYTHIKSLMTGVAPIEEEAWQDFEQHFTTNILKKGQELWKAGETCRQLVFINYGLIRSFRYTATREVSTHFYFENQLFYDDYSFISQQPCTDTYETIEETELVVIPKAAVHLMFDRYKSFERLGRMMAECHLATRIKEQLSSKTLSSKDKYLRLLSGSPHIIQRVPLKFIASYLDMTPEHLSKLRHDLSR